MRKGPPRRFDWHEARMLRGEGLTYAQIAARLGVSATAVLYACRPDARARMTARSAEFMRGGTCPDCGGPASRNYTTGPHRCRSCAARRMATSVREHRLRCVVCKEWKPDESFARHASYGHRRGRHKQCRECNTAHKRRWRDDNREHLREYDRARKAKAA